MNSKEQLDKITQQILSPAPLASVARLELAADIIQYSKEVAHNTAKITAQEILDAVADLIVSEYLKTKRLEWYRDLCTRFGVIPKE